MSDIQKLTQKILKFRDQREWKQFHKPKDMALSLALEAAEVIEHFQWKNDKEIETYIKSNKEKIGEELMDVLYWVLLIAHDIDLNIVKTFEKKMKKNEQNYPIKKSKGKTTKYSNL